MASKMPGTAFEPGILASVSTLAVGVVAAHLGRFAAVELTPHRFTERVVAALRPGAPVVRALGHAEAAGLVRSIHTTRLVTSGLVETSIPGAMADDTARPRSQATRSSSARSRWTTLPPISITSGSIEISRRTACSGFDWQ